MRRFFLFLLLASISFCAAFGNSKIEIARQWNVSGGAGDVNFTGMLVVNNSNQKVLEIYAEPPLSVRGEGERIFVFYDGPFNGTASYSARAVIIVDYNNNITRDGPLPAQPVNGTQLVMWDNGIKETAESIAIRDSSLETIAAVANWVGANMAYDTSYFGLTRSAADTMDERRGVCVEYTHLFISMMNSLGFRTRYVGGYVMGGVFTSEVWQPHAWAEVYAADRWVPVDPTFKEAGILSNSHVALSYGSDANDIYDKVIMVGDATLTSSTELRIIEENEDGKGTAIALSFDNQTNTLAADVTNARDDYVFGTYVLTVPQEYGGEKRNILLLKPRESYKDYLVFPSASFKEGYRYTIPARASFNDASDMLSIVIAPSPPAEEIEGCAPAFVLLLAPTSLLLAMIKNKLRFVH